MKRCKADAFTLIELLVVVAIISILAGLLLPALTSARQRAQSAVCTQRLKQFSVAERCYANDYRGCPAYGLNDDAHCYWKSTDFLFVYGYLPWNSGYWFKYYSGVPAVKYYDSGEFLQSWGCPSERNANTAGLKGLGENDMCIRELGLWQRFHSVKRPSKLIFFGDVTQYANVYYRMTAHPIRHHGGDNYLFYDGHTEWWPESKIRRYIYACGWQHRLPLLNFRIYPDGSSDAE